MPYFRKVLGLGSSQSKGVIIPHEIARKLGIEIGDYLMIEMDGEKIIIKKVEVK